MRGRWIAAAAVGAVFLLALFLARGIRFPPDIPIDPDHPRGLAERRCLHCHGPDGSHPRSPNHPLVDTCRQCHSPAAAPAR